MNVMPSKTKQLNATQLQAYEATRDLAAELLQSVRETLAGKVHEVSPEPFRPSPAPTPKRS